MYVRVVACGGEPGRLCVVFAIQLCTSSMDVACALRLGLGPQLGDTQDSKSPETITVELIHLERRVETVSSVERAVK